MPTSYGFCALDVAVYFLRCASCAATLLALCCIVIGDSLTPQIRNCRVAVALVQTPPTEGPQNQVSASSVGPEQDC